MSSRRVMYLDQAVYWKNIKGEMLNLEDISPRYLGNIYAMVLRNARRPYRGFLLREMWSMESCHGGSGNMPDGVYSAFCQVEAEYYNPQLKDAQDWIRETLLMTRIRELLEVMPDAHAS